MGLLHRGHVFRLPATASPCAPCAGLGTRDELVADACTMRLYCRVHMGVLEVWVKQTKRVTSWMISDTPSPRSFKKPQRKRYWSERCESPLTLSLCEESFLRAPSHSPSPSHHCCQSKSSWLFLQCGACCIQLAVSESARQAIWKGAIMGIGPCILTKVCCAPFMGEALLLSTNFYKVVQL